MSFSFTPYYDSNGMHGSYVLSLNEDAGDMYDITTTATRSNQHIQEWLKVSRLIDEMKDVHLLRKCVEEIADAMTCKQTLYLLAKSASHSEVNLMRAIICKLKLSQNLHKMRCKPASLPPLSPSPTPPLQQPKVYATAVAIEQEDEDDDLSDIVSTAPSPTRLAFNALAENCISNICAYLDRFDVSLFKSTCKQIGIICLDIQLKVHVAVYNTNRLFVADDGCANLHSLMSTQLGSITRYSPNMPLYRLYEQWSTEYAIAHEHQLIVKWTGGRQQIFDSIAFPSDTVQNIQRPASFLVVDKTKIVVLNSSGTPRKMDIYKDTLYTLQDHKFIMLEYFDVATQKTRVAQFLLCERYTTYAAIVSYVENKFICLDTLNNEWHKELLFNLKQIACGKQVSKLQAFVHNATVNTYNMFSYDANRYLHHDQIQNELTLCERYEDTIHPSVSCITLQFNPNTKWFQSTNKFDLAKENVLGFHRDAKDFFTSHESVHITLTYNKPLKQFCDAVRHHYLCSLNEQEREAFDINELCQRLQGLQAIELELKKPNLTGLIRQKISEMLDRLVLPEHIELFHGFPKERRLPWREDMRWVPSVTSAYNSYMYPPYQPQKQFQLNLDFEIVLYDAKNMPPDYRVYQIKVFEPHQCPHPYREHDQYRHENDIETVVFQYKSQFVVGDFIRELMVTNKQRYRHLFGKYLTANDEIHEKMQFVLTSKSGHGLHAHAMDEPFTCNHMDAEPNCIEEFKLYLLDRAVCPDAMSAADRAKLVIRFSTSTGFCTKVSIHEVERMQFEGIPLMLWIGPNDTLADLMERHLGTRSKQCVKFTYRVMAGRKVVNISKSQRAKYKPYRQFLKENPNDFIVITFSKEMPLCTPFPAALNKMV